MDFTLSPEIEDIRVRTRAFVEEHVLPLEADPREFLRTREHPARSVDAAAGRRRAPRACGRRRRRRSSAAWRCRSSPGPRCTRRPGALVFGPLAFNCMAPDDGNMNLLAKVGTPAQKEKWLRPIIDGKVQLVVRDDRAGAGRRLRPVDDPHARGEDSGGKWVITGTQVVHHRRRRGVAFHPGCEDLRRCAQAD